LLLPYSTLVKGKELLSLSIGVNFLKNPSPRNAFTKSLKNIL